MAVILADYCPLDALFYRNHGKLFRLITSLIFNRFSIRKKFWKAETQGFPTIVSTVCHVKSMGASTAGDSGLFFILWMHLSTGITLNCPLVSLSENTHKCTTNPGHGAKMRGDIPRAASDRSDFSL